MRRKSQKLIKQERSYEGLLVRLRKEEKSLFGKACNTRNNIDTLLSAIKRQRDKVS